MSKKTLKPRRFMFFTTFLYGLLFWCLVPLSLGCVIALAKGENAVIHYVIAGVIIACNIGIGVLQRARRKTLSLKLPIRPQEIPYTSTELKHYLGLQPDDNFSEDYYSMLNAFRAIATSKMIKIITYSEDVEERRSAAKPLIETINTKLSVQQCPVLSLKQDCPILLDTHRNRYYLLPHFIIRIAAKNDITAISYADFHMRYCGSSFILGSDDKVPSDTDVIGQAYEHTNIDGTPDARIKDNPSTPIIKTGEIHVDNHDIHYQFSDSASAEKFYDKYFEFVNKAIKEENIKRVLKEVAQQIRQGQLDLEEIGK